MCISSLLLIALVVMILMFVNCPPLTVHHCSKTCLTKALTTTVSLDNKGILRDFKQLWFFKRNRGYKDREGPRGEDL